MGICGNSISYNRNKGHPTVKMAANVPKKQMAQVIEKTGGPVQFKEIDVQQPGPDEVLINIKYSGVCHTDLHAVNGDWPLPTKLPLVGGHEGAGVVVAKGDLVEDIEIGEHAGVKWINGTCLACDFCQQADEPLCAKALLSGYTVDGSFQQYCIAKAAHVARLHKDIPLDAVAQAVVSARWRSSTPRPWASEPSPSIAAMRRRRCAWNSSGRMPLWTLRRATTWSRKCKKLRKMGSAHTRSFLWL